MSKKIGIGFERRKQEEKKRDKRIEIVLTAILITFLSFGIGSQSSIVLIAGIFLMIFFATLWLGDLLSRVQNRIEEQTYDDLANSS